MGSSFSFIGKSTAVEDGAKQHGQAAEQQATNTIADEGHTDYQRSDEIQPLRFLSLPSELRLEVYSLAVHDYLLHINYMSLEDLRDRHFTQPALLGVSRQVRLEYLKVLYEEAEYRRSAAWRRHSALYKSTGWYSWADATDESFSMSCLLEKLKEVDARFRMFYEKRRKDEFEEWKKAHLSETFVNKD